MSIQKGHPTRMATRTSAKTFTVVGTVEAFSCAVSIDPTPASRRVWSAWTRSGPMTRPNLRRLIQKTTRANSDPPCVTPSILATMVSRLTPAPDLGKLDREFEQQAGQQKPEDCSVGQTIGGMAPVGEGKDPPQIIGAGRMQ